MKKILIDLGGILLLLLIGGVIAATAQNQRAYSYRGTASAPSNVPLGATR